MSLPRHRVVAAALVTSVLSLVPVALTASPASAATTLYADVRADPEAGPAAVPGDPTLITNGSTERVVQVAVTPSATATNVTVTPTGDGLAFTKPTYPYPSINGRTELEIGVRATTPGFHTLTITVTADGAAPAVTTLDRLWAPGGPHLVSTGSLAGQTWGGQSADRFGGRGPLGGTLVTFIDDRTAYVGAGHGTAAGCPTPTWDAAEGCVSYALDAATGLLEIGSAIGIVRPGAISLSGITTTSYFGSSDVDSRLVVDTRLAVVPAGTRYGVTWRYHDYAGRAPKKRLVRTLTLRKDGTFVVRSGARTSRRGTYAVKADGVIVYRGRFDDYGRIYKRDRQTFLSVLGPSGKANPKKYGAWVSTYVPDPRGFEYDTSDLLIPT